MNLKQKKSEIKKKKNCQNVFFQQNSSNIQSGEKHDWGISTKFGTGWMRGSHLFVQTNKIL